MINELKEIYEAKNLLIQSCRTEEQLLKLNQFITSIEKNLELYGLVESVELYFSIKDYYLLAQYINRRVNNKEDVIIVDCGSFIGLQQIFFQDYFGYIAIDKLNYFQQITDNAKFLHGTIQDILPMLDSKGKELVGISNMCCSIYPTALESFKNKFDLLVSM